MLSDEKCQMIYDAALTIIAEIGMTVPHAEAREILVKGAGATVEANDVVKIPRDAVAAARDTIPEMIHVYDRNGELAMQLGGTNSYFGTGSDLMSIYDFETGERRLSVLADTARMAHLCDGLPNIDFIMSAAHPHDIEAYASYLECFRAMVSNTTKPMVMTAAGVEDLEVMWKIASRLPRRRRASCARSRTSSSTASPSARCSTPPRCSTSCSSAPTGASRSSTPRRRSPAPRRRSPTPATSCRPSAESLFGVVIHQLRRPGSPLLTGMGPVKLDMNTVQALYNSAEYYTTYLGITEMAKWMDIPNWGYAGTSDSQCVDANAGIDITELTLLSMQAGSNLNHDIGYLDFGLTGAGELVVLTDEVISMNRRALEGIEVSEETLALDTIAAVGQGGDFLGQKHTKRHVREPAVEADDPQPQHAEELGGRRRARRHREGASQARRHHDEPHARAAQRRDEADDGRAGRRVRRRRQVAERAKEPA